MKYLKILIAFVCGFSLQSYGESSDSTVTRSSLFVIPHASYQQETSVAPGVAGGYYFKSNDISRISSISGSAIYTFKHQFLFNITPKIYLNNAQWYLYSNLNFRNYPDYYYGISNRPTELKLPYTSRVFSVLVQPQYALSKKIYMGATVLFNAQSVVEDSTFAAQKESIFQRFGDAGWAPFYRTAVGVSASFDSRDNHFYPKEGIFAKIMLNTSVRQVGSSHSLTDFQLDFRQYVPVFDSHVWAWQLHGAGVFGSNIPFQLLPTLGGRDLMRGFRQGMYSENVMMLAQTEYRFPVWKKLRAAVFCSAGDVMNSNGMDVDKLKVAYGGGLRYQINDARVHLRLDFARNNYGDKLQFYITATEAF